VNGNPCKCIDCGGTEPGHSSDCTYMKELHGANQVTPSTTNTAARELLEDVLGTLLGEEAIVWVETTTDGKYAEKMHALCNKARQSIASLTKQPAASEGDDGDGVANCAECGAFLESVRPGKHQHPTCSQANTSKQAAGEDCENMIDPVQIKVSIPGQLGTTVRFVERSWLYPNN